MRTVRTTTKTMLVLTVATLAALAASTLAAPAVQGVEKKEGGATLDKGGGPADKDDPIAPLAGFVGTWQAQVRAWPASGAEPDIDEGTSINEVVLDGKFLQMRYKGSFQKQTFVGIGYDGYDEAKGKYVSVWMDSMSPGVSTMEGTFDPQTKSWTYFGQGEDPASGKLVDMRTIVTIKSSTMRTYQSWAKSADGDWKKNLEIIFTKVK